MHDVDPKYCLPSHAHVTSKLVPLAREKALRAVTAQLEKAEFIALTIDIWTDRPMHSYFGVTAHSFISYESKSNLIHFGAFKGSHTGAKIAAEITKVTAEYKLAGKVVYVTSDNASNMRKTFELIHITRNEDDDETSAQESRQ